MLKVTVITSLLVALAVSAPQAQTVLDRPFPNYLGLSLQQMNLIVAGNAGDPLSGQYRNMVFGVDQDGNKSICGYVNFRNAQGGYDPFVAFGFTEKDQPHAYVSHFALGEPIETAPDLEALGCKAALSR